MAMRKHGKHVLLELWESHSGKEGSLHWVKYWDTQCQKNFPFWSDEVVKKEDDYLVRISQEIGTV